ncbi:MAG TPA: WavE lipopolysaccharide synthesis family protein [Nitrospira sp.]|nr:WavE lipopolysaccharide synthesis family protein [Nitrospira sp.]
MMPVKESDVTIVFQGPVVPGADGTAGQIARTRQAFPQARFVLSTWVGSDCRDIRADRIVFSEDPGGLPGIKRRDGRNELNNVNRQLRSTTRGLAVVETGYAIKIRSDCALDHRGVLDAFDRWSAVGPASRLVACSLFTIDPQMFEQMAYHVSDWVQCGATGVLQQYWSAPFMDETDATYYERVPYGRHSTFMDRRFRCRLAVEQYVACRYAACLGYAVPAFHNDIRPEVMRDHRRFLAEQMAIVDPWEIGLHFPKYAWAYRSAFQRLNCLLFEDWYQLYREEYGARSGDAPVDRRARSRRRRKRMARALSQLVDCAGPLLVRPGCKQMINRFLSLLAESRRPNEESSTVRSEALSTHR